jgi:hypothetical protein
MKLWTASATGLSGVVSQDSIVSSGRAGDGLHVRFGLGVGLRLGLGFGPGFRLGPGLRP